MHIDVEVGMSKPRLVAAVPVVALVLALLVPSPAAVAAAPTFTQVTPTGSDLFVTGEETDFWINAVAPADVDSDGDLDLAVLGFFVVYHESVEDILVLFINEGPDGSGGWSFTEQRVPLGDVFAGSSDLAWGDFDGDADPDLAVGSEGATILYRNEAGVLTALDTDLPGYDEDSSYTGAYDLRSLTWADSDNDGDLDLLVPSVLDRDVWEYSTHLLRNDGSNGAGGWVFTDTTPGFDATVHAQSAWADDDGDADLDLFLTNIDPYTDTGFVRRYENSAGTFTPSDLLGIKVEYGLADWGDYDQDGDLDILVVGNIQETDETYNTVLRIYRNDGGTYVQQDLPTGAWLDIHAATWADYDSDGDVDLLVTGSFVGDAEIVGKSEIYTNEGAVFTPLDVQLPAPVSSVGRGGAFTWFDLDNDRDLDYLVAGAYYVPDGNGLVEAQINLFENSVAADNEAPAAPTGLTASSEGDSVALAWTAAGDDSTAAEAMTYQLDIEAATGAAAVAIAPSKHLPEPGNLSATTDWQLEGLAPGDYTWTVRAVDSAFNESPPKSGSFSVEGAALEVSATPTAPPVKVPASGGSFTYEVEITNNSAVRQTFDVWATYTTPSGKIHTAKQSNRSLKGGATATLTWTQTVKPKLGPGTYTQTVWIGAAPAAGVDSSSFTWVKRPPR